MNAKIDSVGRVVIPKALRQRCSLCVDAAVEITEHKGGVLLRAVPSDDLLVERDGLLVFTGELEGDPDNAVQELRTERLTALDDSIEEA